MSYGDKVKEYRELRKMTQEVLAEQTGIVASSISKIEHGTRKVTLEEAVRLSQVLRIRLEDLTDIGTGTRQYTRETIEREKAYSEAITRLAGLSEEIAQLQALFHGSLPPPQKGTKSYSSQKYSTLYQKDHAFASKWHFV